jgi:Na+-translocating ferredoxin:NAD+ oxidoreductase RnfG subunit
VAASVTRIFGRGAIARPVAVNSDTALRVTRGDSVLGFAVVRNVKGKDQPITFLVATDTADKLKDIDVLVYREPYGGEVAYEAWRRQFRGKAASDTLEVGRQIRSISGATISVNAVTVGVRRALADLTAWHREGVLK